MRKLFVSSLALSILLTSTLAECRIGGGRSFGSRGARGFSAPRSNSSFSNRNYDYSNRARPFQPQTTPLNPAPSQPAGSSFLRSMGAGLAGGMLGSMLFRSFGGGGYGMGHGGGGGVGPLEILLLGGLLFLLFRMWIVRREQSSSQSASGLMRQARPFGWGSEEPTLSEAQTNHFDASHQMPHQASHTTSMSPEVAMDLFFQIQGAWGNRDLTPVDHLLDTDAKIFLDQDIARLKAARQINRLENIAIRNTEVTDSWKEADLEYSTVRYSASLLDFTIDEQTQQIVDGSKNTPIKFEEFWTFSKPIHSSSWKLSAIQQD